MNQKRFITALAILFIGGLTGVYGVLHRVEVIVLESGNQARQLATAQAMIASYQALANFQSISDNEEGFTVYPRPLEDVENFLRSQVWNQPVEVNDCRYYARNMINTAVFLHFMAGVVDLHAQMPDGTDSGHVLAVFQTTDAGLVFIEPQNGEIVTLPIGGQECQINGYCQDWIVVDYTITW